MKTYFFAILLCALAMYSCTACEGAASSVSDCEKRDLETGAYRCWYGEVKAYVLGQTIDKKECGPLTKEEYDNIEKYMEDGRKQIESLGGKIDKFKIDCNSNYIIISMLALLLLFL